jgi:UrcA family protein
MTSTQTRSLSLWLPAALAFAALNSTARAEDLNQIVVRGSDTTTIGYDYHDLRPIQQQTVKVDVSYDPVTLTTNSGVALLKDAVQQAAYKACTGDDNLMRPDYSCIRTAIEQARPQIAQAVARARNAANG